jgi:N-sulfoglucosamine sulfohydrolase
MNGPPLHDKPINVLYLHSHDTGRYIQPYGHPVPTPNLQRLADQGILFRQAFAAAATCSGSRAALITGEYPHRNGMMGLAHRGWRLHDYRHHLVYALRGAGYHSELIGEQHVSDDPGVLGYDRVHDITSNHVATVAPLAVERLRAGLPEPFFLSVGFFETHRTFFEPSTIRDELDSAPPVNLPDTPAIRRDMAAFKASARHLDQGVGDVLAALDENGLGTRTLVICTTDHGLPFPGAKATLYDRGLGVLLILRGPDGLWGGRVVDAAVSHLDLFPTVCELAGIEPPGRLDGTSLLPLVRGDVARLHDELFAEITYHAAYEPQRAIRTDRFKYIRRFDDRDAPVLPNVDDGPTKDELIAAGWAAWRPEPEQLFDLAIDPDEMRNVVEEPRLRGVADDLRARLRRWMEETDDPLLDGPVPLPPGAWANSPDQRSAAEPVPAADSAAA